MSFSAARCKPICIGSSKRCIENCFNLDSSQIEVSRALKLLGGVGPALLRHADAVRLADCDLGIAREILLCAKRSVLSGVCEQLFGPPLTRTDDSESAESVLDPPIEVPT
jgi:hypothetical protein